MNNTTPAAIVHALLLTGLAAAACEHRGSITGPTPAPTPTVAVASANISISGVVYDTAHRLLQGARVEVIEGTVGDWCHYDEPARACVVAAFTDASGRFTFSGPFYRVTRLHASMEGYRAATVTVDSTASTGVIEFRLEPSGAR